MPFIGMIVAVTIPARHRRAIVAIGRLGGGKAATPVSSVPCEVLNMSKLGFFAWIRDGVRRAVLLGVSDAVDQLGSPEDRSPPQPNFLAALRQSASQAIDSSPSAGVIARPGRKRLGRSLAPIQHPSPPTSAPAP